MYDLSNQAPVRSGEAALVLHAHLPDVRHAGREDAAAERRFYETITDSILPLAEMLERLGQEGADCRVTLAMTPVLMAMCADPLMQERFADSLKRQWERAVGSKRRLGRERKRIVADGEPDSAAVAVRLERLLQQYEHCGRNVLTVFRKLQEDERLEVIPSAATHAHLHLLATEEAIRAQIRTGLREYVRHFGRKPRGFWLPECVYAPGIDRLLKMEGVDYVIVDAQAVRCASPSPNRGLYAPLMTTYGVTAFPRHPEAVGRLHAAVRNCLYAHVADSAGVPSALEGEERAGEPQKTRLMASEQASHLLHELGRQTAAADAALDRDPLLVLPCSIELFSCEWTEYLGRSLQPDGLELLEQLCRISQRDRHLHGLRLVTPHDYLERYPLADTGRLSAWGSGYGTMLEFRLPLDRDPVYRRLHQAEERMVETAARCVADEVDVQAASMERDAANSAWSSGAADMRLRQRALDQAARELMLAQSSDWVQMRGSRLFASYAEKRLNVHLYRFGQLCAMVDAGRIDPERLKAMEQQAGAALPCADFRDYAPVAPRHPALSDPQTRWHPHVFMLAWEYPPKCVGGLSRAVADLAEALAARGEWAVHVVTTACDGAPAYERRHGVHVHRLPVLCTGETDFYHWTFELNLAMTDFFVSWRREGGRIDLVHAHDWMVCQAAREIKIGFGVPLVATIHATEWGRQQGRLHSELSHRIHELEWRLTYEAEQLFVCSRHMKEEVERIFELPAGKTAVVPNGIVVPQADEEDAAITAGNGRFQHGEDNEDGAAAPGGIPNASGEPGASGIGVCAQLSGTENGLGHPAAASEALTDNGANRAEQDGRIMLYVGRLVYEKGIHVLLEAVPGVLARVPEARLVIVGAGPMRDQLERRSAELGLGERVWFAGFVADETKARLYRSAELCVFPSLYEPFGIVALEAMAARRPLVVSDTGGLAELVEHERDGRKALPGNAESLAWQLSETLLHPGRAAAWADRAYEKAVCEYGMASIASRVQEHYERVLGARPEDAAGRARGAEASHSSVVKKGSAEQAGDVPGRARGAEPAFSSIGQEEAAERVGSALKRARGAEAAGDASLEQDEEAHVFILAAKV